MKLISLTQGQFAMVDDEDYEYLNQYRWYAKKVNNKFYARRTQWIPESKTEKNISIHQLIMKPKAKIIIDHIDGNPLNNQRSNLRLCTHRQNMCNRAVAKNKKSSIYLGVYERLGYRKHTTKSGENKIYTSPAYIVMISENNKNKYIGKFPFTPKGEIDAAKLYDERAKLIHGEFANLNFK